MKQAFFLLVALISISSASVAAQSKKLKTLSQKICDSFQTKVDDECAHIMCDDSIANGDYKDLNECTGASDYAEAAQETCDGQATSIENLVQAYNEGHAAAAIMCE